MDRTEGPVVVAAEQCGWCSAPAVTHVITVPGRKTRRVTPVCEQHALDFERRGVKTTRSEVDEQMPRPQWKRRQS